MDSEERPRKKEKKGITDKPTETGQDGSLTQMIAVKDIRTHPLFESLLRIDDADQERFTRKMGEEGYFPSEALVLAVWEGQLDPVVIDGNRRLQAARDNGIEQVPCVIEKFPDLMGALRRAIALQMERRQNDDSTTYRLCEEFDEVMQRGGDRRSEEAKSILQSCIVERGSTTSARRTAKIIGCNYRKVYQIRRIRKDGTTQIQDAVRNGEMGINNAYSMIRDMELGKDENKRNSAADTKAAKRLLTEENFERVSKHGGDVCIIINAALEFYLPTLDNEEPSDDRDE